MIITYNQREFFGMKARVVLERMRTFSKGGKIDLEDGYQVSLMVGLLEEVCGIGHSIAMGEVHSTPWEYLSVPIEGDAAANNDIMNTLSKSGWDLHIVASGWQFWRRRRAVSEGGKSGA